MFKTGLELFRAEVRIDHRSEVGGRMFDQALDRLVMHSAVPIATNIKKSNFQMQPLWALRTLHCQKAVRDATLASAALRPKLDIFKWYSGQPREKRYLEPVYS